MKQIHPIPENLDLCVSLNNGIGYISGNDWLALSSSAKKHLVKKGIFISGNGEKFVLALNDLQVEELTWSEAMTKYGDSLPDKEQMAIIAENIVAINQSIEALGGTPMWEWYWTKTECDSTTAWAAYMTYNYLSKYTKESESHVRAVIPVRV